MALLLMSTASKPPVSSRVAPALAAALAEALGPSSSKVIASPFALVAVVLSALFLLLALPVGSRMKAEGDKMLPEKRLFKYSIVYLFVLFAALVADRVAAYQGWMA